MDSSSGLIIRTGQAVCNLFDLSAVEASLQIRKAVGGTIDAFTMGPERAAEILRDVFALGVDSGYLLCDRAFAGADVLATSYTLAQGILAAGQHDLIICGSRTTDGDTGQVPGAVAAWLDIPYLANVISIGKIQADSLVVDQNLDGVIQTVCAKLPCLLSVEREWFLPRLPTLKLRLSSRTKPITQWGIANLAQQDPNHYGLAGSATKVDNIFSPPMQPHTEVNFLPAQKQAHYLAEILMPYLPVKEGEQT